MKMYKNITLNIISKLRDDFNIYSFCLGCLNENFIKDKGNMTKGKYFLSKDFENLNSVIISKLNNVFEDDELFKDINIESSLDEFKKYNINDIKEIYDGDYVYKCFKLFYITEEENKDNAEKEKEKNIILL